MTEQWLIQDTKKLMQRRNRVILIDREDYNGQRRLLKCKIVIIRTNGKH